jgi:hypothetical protein
MSDCQLWPRIGYGICNNSTSWNELEGCLQRVYRQLVGRGGVCYTAPVELRQLDQGFFGIGCPHPGVECLVAQLTKLLVHYGCRSGVGIQMQVSTEVMLTELGLSPQPFQESFVKHGKWATNTWLTSIWEKVDKFNIKVEIAPLPISPPHEGDKWFMKAVIKAGVTNLEELVKRNRFRCHQQVLFVSDILDAGDKCLDKKYLKRQQDNESWSTLIFPIKNLPRKHERLWEQVLYSLAPRHRANQSMGQFLTKGHKIWDWRYDEEAKRVYHIKGQRMDIYTHSAVPFYANRPNSWC